MERMILCVIFAIFSASSVQCKCAVCVPYSGIYNCASNRFLRFNCVRLASFTSGNAREVRIKNCKVNVFIGNGITGKQRFPVVRDKSGITCPHFAPMLQTTQPEPDHVTAKSTLLNKLKTVQTPTKALNVPDTDDDLFDEAGTTAPKLQTTQPEPDHVTAKSTLLNKLKTVKTPTKALNVPDTDDDLFDEAGTTGFFAWAVLTTIALILLIVKKLVLQRCDLKCCTQPLPSPPQPQTIEPFEDRIPMNPIMHTPPSQASTPDTPSTVMSTPDTPSTVTSSAPLVSQHEPVSANTRSKKKLF